MSGWFMREQEQNSTASQFSESHTAEDVKTIILIFIVHHLTAIIFLTLFLLGDTKAILTVT